MTKAAYIQTSEHSRLAVETRGGMVHISMQHRLAADRDWFTEQGVVFEPEHVTALVAALEKEGEGKP